MQCLGCGASYESSYRFCPFCGRAAPEPDVLRVRMETPTYEYCEISPQPTDPSGFGEWFNALVNVFFGFGVTKFTFAALAVGPNGRYIAGQSTVVEGYDRTSVPPLISTRQVRNAFDAFLVQLLQERWEPFGPAGEYWFSIKLRRRLE